MLIKPGLQAISGSEEQRRLRHWLRGALHQFISHVEISIESSTNPGSLAPLQAMVCEVETALAMADQLASLDLSHESLQEFAAQLRRPVEAIEQTYAGLLASAAESPDAAMLAKLQTPVRQLGSMLGSLQPDQVERIVSQQAATPGRSELPDASPRAAARGVALVIDDNEGNRELLSRRLMRSGCDVLLAENGRQALRMVRRYAIDILLLDIMMPEMDGYAVLAELKKDPALRHLPVIMISAVDDMDSVVHCINSGADDYLFKPFNAVLLHARVHALLERKRLHDEDQSKKIALERAYGEIQQQREKTEALLLNILPQTVAEELRENGFVEPIYYEDTTIVFADIAGFTLQTESLSAEELVHKLNRYFSAFDTIAQKYGIEKLKTIGDCYMFAGGLPKPSRSHPVTSILASIEMQQAAARLDDRDQAPFRLRIGVHTGPVIGGVVGLHKFAFDVWGDTVNLASRVETCGEPGRINISGFTYARVKDFFRCEKRGAVRIKDGRDIEMYFIDGLSHSLSRDAAIGAREAFIKRYRSYFHEIPRAFPAELV
jgi:class 3 adenylate cyclase/CheY-like chemotaxis protein